MKYNVLMYNSYSIRNTGFKINTVVDLQFLPKY